VEKISLSNRRKFREEKEKERERGKDEERLSVAEISLRHFGIPRPVHEIVNSNSGPFDGTRKFDGIPFVYCVIVVGSARSASSREFSADQSD